MRFLKSIFCAVFIVLAVMCVTITASATEYDDISEDMTMFHDPLNIMFNNYVMTQDTDMKTTMIWSSLDKLPTCFYVDYVRLYQKPGVGGLWTAVPEKPYPSTNS